MSLSLARKPKPAAASITAAARALNVRGVEQATLLKQVTGTARQAEAWKLYGISAELHYPCSYIGRNVGRFTFPVGYIPADDLSADPAVPEPDKRTDLYRAAEEIMFAFTGRFGGIQSIADAYAKNMAVAGEGWLVGEQEAGSIIWHLFSVREFGPADAADTRGLAYRRYPTGRTNGGYRGEEDSDFVPGYVRRVWQPSPELSEYADTSTFSVLEDLKDLVTLNRSLRARLVSRLTQAGILFVPSSLSLAGPIGAPTGDGSAVDDPFAAKLLDTLERQMLSGEAPAVPTVIRGDADAGEAIRFILTDRTIDRVELELRAEKRSNIAKGMFLPPEVVEGMGSSTHWQSWSVSDSAFSHLLPYAQGFADVLTRTYLWPALTSWVEENRKDYTQFDIRRHCVLPDGSNVITRPNEAEDGRQLHDRITISDRALRSRSGVSETDAPTEEEAIRQLGRKMNNPYLATYGLDIHDKIDWEAVAAVGQAPGRPGVGSVDEGHRPADSSDPAGAPGEGETQVEEDQMSARVLAAAAPGFLLAARKKIGAKLRARTEPNKALHGTLKNLPNEEVLGHLDLDEVDLHPTEVKGWFATELAPIGGVVGDLDPGLVETFIDHLADLEVNGGSTPEAVSAIALRVTSPPNR